MRSQKLLLISAMLLTFPAWSLAVTTDDFKVQTTQSLLNLCTAPQNDALHVQAISFCHGFLVGAFKYYEAETSGPNATKLVCLPSSPPTRHEAIQMFLKWANAHPEYLQERPVETEFRFLTETWPCTP